MQFAVAILFMLLMVSVACGRTWSDDKGRQVEAELVGVNANTVSIRRSADGKVFHVPLELFSESDQAFVAHAVRPGVIDEAAIKRQIGDAEVHGLACGLTIFEGKPAGAYMRDYRIHVPGFGERQHVTVGYIQARERGNFVSEFRGPGFVYELKDGRLSLKPRKEPPPNGR